MPFRRESDFYYLSREEKGFLKRYGIEEESITKESLARLMDRESIKKSIHDSNLMNAIKKKMNMQSFSSLEHTSHIPLDTEAKFYLTNEEFCPIKLYKSLDNFQLWEVKLHKNSSLLKRTVDGKVILEYYNVSYGYETKILDTFHLDKDYIKTPHSSLRQLSQRKHPRIKIEIPLTLRTERKEYEGKMKDISIEGAKVDVKNDGMLARSAKVTLHFYFQGFNYKLMGKIVYAGIYSIGILFDSMPTELRHFIERELKQMEREYNDTQSYW